MQKSLQYFPLRIGLFLLTFAVFEVIQFLIHSFSSHCSFTTEFILMVFHNIYRRCRSATRLREFSAAEKTNGEWRRRWPLKKMSPCRRGSKLPGFRAYYWTKNVALPRLSQMIKTNISMIILHHKLFNLPKNSIFHS